MPLDTEDGKTLFAEDIVAKIKSDLEKRRSDRKSLELAWVLNANFLAGHQNCDINVHSGRIEDYIPEHDYMSRGIYNRVAPLIQTRIANLRTVQYGMMVKPKTNEVDDYQKADVSTKLLEYAQSNGDFQKKMDTAYQWAALTGTAFWYSWWDTRLGGMVAKTEVTEVTDDGTMSIRLEDIHEGDLAYGLLSSYEVFPEDMYQQEVSDQYSVIVEQVMNKKEVYDLYGVEEDGQEIETYTLMPTPAAGLAGQEQTVFSMEKETRSDAVRVITYYERRSRKNPNGKMAVITGDRLIYYGDMPYREIPITAVKDQIVQGQFFGKSIIQDLIPLQRAYNACLNKVYDYIATVGANPLAVAAGSVDVDDLTDNGIPPGKIVEYKPEYGGPPQFMANPELPGTVLKEIERLENSMEYTAAVSQMMVVGATPTGVTSGTAIENLRQIDNTRLSLTAESFRDAVRSMARLWLYIYKDRSANYRAMQACGADNGGSVIVWSTEDITSFDVDFTTENELKNSPERQKENFLQAFQMGLFAGADGTIPREVRAKAWELMRVGNTDDIMGIDDVQRKNAQRENVLFEAGSVPKVDEQLDDDEIHLDAHMRYALSMRFRMMERRSPEYAQAFREHMAQHQARIAQMAQIQQIQNIQNNGGIMR